MNDDLAKRFDAILDDAIRDGECLLPLDILRDALLSAVEASADTESGDNDGA